jgi:putative ABC transport system ATP-binding protein
MMSILELKNVTYSYMSKYNKTEAVKNVSYEFERGKVYAIVGKSGSGKSTLLSLLAGLDLPQSGQVLFEGKCTAEMDLAQYRRQHAAMIYQSFRLFPLLTVTENITYPMGLRGFKGKPASDKAKELAIKMDLPETVLNRFPSMLSGGEQQRVALQGIIMETKVLLADEPTGNLDEKNSTNIIDILVKLAHNEGYLVIIATHDLGILHKMDHVLYMNSGNLRLDES